MFEDGVLVFLRGVFLVTGTGALAWQWMRERRAGGNGVEARVLPWQGRIGDFLLLAVAAGFIFVTTPALPGILFSSEDGEVAERRMFWGHLFGSAMTLAVILGATAQSYPKFGMSFYPRQLVRTFRVGVWHPLVCFAGSEALVHAGFLLTAVAAAFLQNYGVSLWLEEKQDVVLVIARHRDEGLFMVSAALSVAVAAPIVEEVFFRGLLYPFFKRFCGVVPAACLTGAAFGAIHFSAAAFFPLALFGVYLCLIYEKTGDIRAPVLTHCLHNLATFCLIAFGWEAV
jgi:membrane protease YdiL (CAAX protease family)